jgi:ribonuclease BN (tRNA processing enzyme)
MRKYAADPNEVQVIILSHLHGDHFGGVPFFIIDAQLVSKRKKPLSIVGPPGAKERISEAMEVLFPGSSKIEQSFALEVLELAPGQAVEFSDLKMKIEAEQGVHPCGSLPLILRLQVGDKVIAYSGDTEWTEGLVKAARGADLFISEAYFYDKNVKNHLNYRTLLEKEKELDAKRTVVTHMSPEMLGRLDSLVYEYSDDGKVFEL